MSRVRLSLVIAASIAALLPSAAEAGPLRLGLHEPSLFTTTPDPQLVAHAAASHASILRGAVYWEQTVPNAVDKPAGFDARNPADPGYKWATVDAFVKQTATLGMQPLLVVIQAPTWAEGLNAADRAKRDEAGAPAGSYRVNPADLGDFAHALSVRYSGTFPDPAVPGSVLPRVKYFQAWNEPNFGEYLTVLGTGQAAAHYSRMLNAFYDEVKATDRSNYVIAAGMGPYGFNGHRTDIDPQLFFRQMFCLSKQGSRLTKAKHCYGPRPKFDVMAQHPYTFLGTPTTKAYSPDGGGIGNMIDMKRILDAAVRLHRALPAGPKSLWVTEFSWYSNPPGRLVEGDNELGKPLPVQAAYLSETAYRLWSLGVGAMVWYSLQDLYLWPGGLYFADGKPKPALRAFRFPFYAHRSGKRLTLWGDLTDGRGARIRFERKRGKRWVVAAKGQADRWGIVLHRMTAAKAGTYRARVLTGVRKGTVSYPFASG